MANEQIGLVDCPFCGDSVPVRKNRNGKLYFNCVSCGVANLHGAGFQEWILNNATIYGDGQKHGNEPRLPPAETEPEAQDDDDSILSIFKF